MMVLEFDSDNPEFRRGVEAGIVWNALSTAPPDFGNYTRLVASDNVEMMQRVATATDWEISLVQVRDEDDNDYPEWVEVVFSRAERVMD